MLDIYLDANASSRIRPSAIKALKEFCGLNPGNASSIHSNGQRQRANLSQARRSVFELLSLSKQEAELVFTSGGTESCHMLIYSLGGGLANLAKHPQHLIVSEIEHAAMLEPIKQLETLGWKVSRILPDKNGVVRLEDFLAELRPETALVSCMSANNETGSIQPICEIARQLRASGYQGVIVSDYIQALLKSPLSAGDLFDSGVDAISISSHKIGGPSGVGAVIYNRHSDLCRLQSPIFLGGVQEKSLRAGSENLLGIVGFGAVAKELANKQDEYRKQLDRCRELLWSLLEQDLQGVLRITPGSDSSICNTLLVAFEDCPGDDLVVALDLEGVKVSTGAACASGKQGQSHVVEVLPIAAEYKDSVVRFSLDWDCSEEQIRQVTSIVAEVVGRIRAVSAPLEVKRSNE